MAKAKKSETEPTEKSASAEKPAKAGKAAAKAAPAKASAASAEPAKSAKKTSKPATKSEKKPGSAPASSPLIDTNLAAAAAAAMVLNRGSAAPSGGSPSGAKESASFKAFKEGVKKPSLPGGLLGSALPQKKGGSNQPFGGGKQVGHNQTFGSDVTRTGVPRRTSG